MSQLDLSKVYKNIYGVDSTNSFEMLGGSTDNNSTPLNYTPRVYGEWKSSVVRIDPGKVSSSVIKEAIKKVDIETNYKNQNKLSVMRVPRGIPLGFSGGLAGGKAVRRNKAGEEIVYSNPAAYSSGDLDFRTFIDEFMLLYTASSPKKSAIFVYPDGAELKKMVKELGEELQAKGIKPRTAAAQKYIATSPLPYKAYLIDVFDRLSTNNEGYNYSLPDSFPAEQPKTLIRRVNRLNDVYYLRCKGGNLEISADEKMTSPSTLEFKAKCEYGVCVFKGSIPKGKTKKTEAKQTVTRISGGSRYVLSHRKNLFNKLLRRANGDADLAAYNYLAYAYCANNVKGVPSPKFMRHMSGNYIHAAFESLLDKELNDSPIDMFLENKEIDKAHQAIMKAYQPKNVRINFKKVNSAIKDLYHRAITDSITGNGANSHFLRGMAAISGGMDTLKADIATSILKADPTANGVDEALTTVDMMDGSTPEVSNVGLTGGGDQKSTPLLNAIYNISIRHPLVGLYAKSAVPIPLYNCPICDTIKKKVVPKGVKKTKLSAEEKNSEQASAPATPEATTGAVATEQKAPNSDQAAVAEAAGVSAASEPAAAEAKAAEPAKNNVDYSVFY